MIKCVSIDYSLFENQKDRVLDKARLLDCRGVELSLSGPNSDAVIEQANTLTGLCRKEGLNVCAVQCSQYGLFHLCDSDEKVRAAALENYEALLAWAGSASRISQDIQEKPLVVIPAQGLPGRGVPEVVSYEQSFHHLYTSLERLMETAEKERIILALENPGRVVLLSPLELRELIDQINSPYLGICFNPVNTRRLGSALDWLEILGFRIKAAHLAATDSDDLKNELHRGILNELQRMQFTGPIIYQKI
jgi:hexulose-6-phosphate isomerase